MSKYNKKFESNSKKIKLFYYLLKFMLITKLKYLKKNIFSNTNGISINFIYFISVLFFGWYGKACTNNDVILFYYVLSFLVCVTINLSLPCVWTICSIYSSEFIGVIVRGNKILRLVIVWIILSHFCLFLPLTEIRSSSVLGKKKNWNKINTQMIVIWLIYIQIIGGARLVWSLVLSSSSTIVCKLLSSSTRWKGRKLLWWNMILSLQASYSCFVF